MSDTRCLRCARPCADATDRLCQACAEAAVGHWARQLGRLVHDVCLGQPGTWRVEAEDAEDAP